MKQATFKPIGKMGIFLNNSDQFIIAHVCLTIQIREYQTLRYTFSAQAGVDSPDRFYALICTRGARLFDYDAKDYLAFLAKLHKAINKESSLAACIVDGKATMGQCELGRLKKAIIKMGFSIKNYESYSKCQDDTYYLEQPCRLTGQK